MSIKDDLVKALCERNGWEYQPHVEHARQPDDDESEIIMATNDVDWFLSQEVIRNVECHMCKGYGNVMDYESHRAVFCPICKGNRKISQISTIGKLVYDWQNGRV